MASSHERYLPIIVIAVLGIYFFGCEKSPVKPKQEAELDPKIEQLAAVGYNMNRIVHSSAEIEEVTNVGQFIDEDGTEGLPTTTSLKKLALNISSKAKVLCSKALENRTESYVDSLLFFMDDTTTGIRKGLYYNAETGIARYYEVKYK